MGLCEGLCIGLPEGTPQGFCGLFTRYYIVTLAICTASVYPAQGQIVGTSWKCSELYGNASIQLMETHGISWNLMESWGIFGLSDVAWSSNSEIMLESSRRMYWKSLEMSA